MKPRSTTDEKETPLAKVDRFEEALARYTSRMLALAKKGQKRIDRPADKQR
jgi:hypothetical protein